MKKHKKNVDIFISEDGKEFLTKEECIHYEENVLSKLENIKYFTYFTSRDITETGMFYNHNYAAVYIERHSSCYKEVLLQYLFELHEGKIIQKDVQGYGVTSSFYIEEISKERYFSKKQNNWGGMKTESKQIFLSEEPIDGYPKNIKVISKVFNYK